MTSVNIAPVTALQKSTLDFFLSDRANLDALLAILQKKYAVRVIEYFMNVYVVKNRIVLENADGTLFDIYLEFSNLSSAFRKKNFDFFRRKEKIRVTYDIDPFDPAKKGCIITTYPQINWYKWAIEVRLFDYIDKHYETIKADMGVKRHKSKKLSRLLIMRSNKPIEIRMN